MFIGQIWVENNPLQQIDPIRGQISVDNKLWCLTDPFMGRTKSLGTNNSRIKTTNICVQPTRLWVEKNR